MAAAMLVMPAVQMAPMAALRRAANDLRPGAGADLGAVFAVGHVADPVDFGFDRPMVAGPIGQVGGFGLMHA